MHELEEERRRLRETTLRFGEALAATHDVDQLLRVIVDTAVQATGATRGELMDGGVVLIANGGERAPSSSSSRLAVGRESFGTLVLYGDDFSSDQRESAGWLVGHAVIALSNARQHRTVEQQALVDSLTGLANRRLCTAALEKELARAKRFGEPLTLVLADIDDFKRINDRWGHPTGDEVLKAFAGRLQESVREIDLAGRWGGEEFALLLPGTDLEGGRRLAERIRQLLREQRVASPDGTPVLVRQASASPPSRSSRARASSSQPPTRRSTRRSGPARTASSSRSPLPSPRPRRLRRRFLLVTIPRRTANCLEKHHGGSMPVETPSLFADVIQDHLELKRKNADLENMPIDGYRVEDPFENHPLFKTEEQARIEDTLDGHPGVAAETQAAATETVAAHDEDGLWGRSRDFDWGD